MRLRTSIQVEDKVWRRFKAVLAMEGKEVSLVIEQFCQDYSDAHEAEARKSVEPTQGT